MILLDTSVWIEYLKRNEGFKLLIDSFLRERKIITLDLIFGELMQGAMEHEKERIIDIWEILPQINIVGLGFYAGKHSMENKLLANGIGLIDSAIIYATIHSNSKLWTLDKKVIGAIDNEYLYTPQA